MNTAIKGVIIPAATPFSPDGEVNYQAILHNIERWNKTEVAGYMCLGSYGEFKALSDEESLQIIRLYAETRSPRKVYIVGIARESTYQTLNFMDSILSQDITPDYFSALTPSYFRSLMTDSALVRYYTEIADHSSVPILLYCAPKFANEVCLSETAVAELASHPNIAGIKDTSSNMIKKYFGKVGMRDDFEIISGSLSNLEACIRLGGVAGVLSAGNYIPNHCSRIFSIWDSDRENFDKYLAKIKTFVKLTGGSKGVVSLKYSMDCNGYLGGPARKPIEELDKESKKHIREAFKQMDSYFGG